jgi:parallel beta-helix repeat protein
MRWSTLSSALASILATASIGLATTIHVPADQPTIQAGITAAVDGDTVLVADGTYTGDGNRGIDFLGKAIAVKSENGPENCIIDCEGSDRGFYFGNGESQNSIVQGFTIKNGQSEYGGGIQCFVVSSPSIVGNIIIDNAASQGGGIHCYDDSSPIIKENIIMGNSASYLGGGIRCTHSSATITKNLIVANSVSGGTYGGGGIYCNNEPAPTIDGNTITGNTAVAGGSGIYCNYSSPTITNSIIWNNEQDEIFIRESTPVVSYSDVGGGWPGEGNINADPLFVDPENDDYHLFPESPCIDTGDPGSPLDPDSTRADMGAYYFHRTGRILRVPDDYPTIQEAVNAAIELDTVLVGADVYPENVTDAGIDRITLLGTEGETIIEGPSGAAGITLTNVSEWEIRWFELSSCWGWGIYIEGSSNCIIRDNYCHHTTGSYGNHGIGVTLCSQITVKNNVTAFCSGAGNCAGIWIWGSTDCEVVNNTVYDNQTDGIIVSMTGEGVDIYNNISVSNGSTGIEFQNNNGAYPDSGAVRYNDSWSNDEEDYAGCEPGEGAIFADPLFVGGAPYDFHLRYSSPCIDAGDPESPPDPDGTRADMGAYYYDQSVPPPILSISVEPDTTYYHKGDLLGFTVTITNNTDTTVYFQGWTEGETPWGLILSPLLGPINVILGPHRTIHPHISQQIPNKTPYGGPYIYRVKAGEYPDSVLAEDSFEFYVVPPGMDQRYGDWEVIEGMRW